MPSGVGNAGDHKVTEVAEAILRTTAEELAIYYPAPSPKAFTERFPQGVILSARAIPHQNIQYIVGRAGWGTIWECVNAKKIFIAIPAIPGDDPEIALNLKTLRQYKLAVCWGDAQPIEEQVREVRKAIEALLSGSKKVDGLKFMADRILERIGPE
jgi:hypothetical protein